MTVESITPAALRAARDRGEPVELLDVRTPAEHREVHATGARLVPLGDLDPAAVVAARATGPLLYVICRSGGRGRQACERFAAAGYPGVVNVEGGMLAWEAAGLPVVRGRPGVSLERQVRVAAGALVLVGAALGAVAHPAFHGLSALVGGGLVVAGLTDTCGLALLLARLPWNRATPPPGPPACTTG